MILDIVQVQDLPSPGTPRNRWRLAPGQLDAALASRLRTYPRKENGTFHGIRVRLILVDSDDCFCRQYRTTCRPGKLKTCPANPQTYLSRPPRFSLGCRCSQWIHGSISHLTVCRCAASSASTYQSMRHQLIEVVASAFFKPSRSTVPTTRTTSTTHAAITI